MNMYVIVSSILIDLTGLFRVRRGRESFQEIKEITSFNWTGFELVLSS